MKIKTIFTGFIALALLVFPAFSLANTYNFVDTSGNLQSMEASNPSIALNTAYQLGVHSGVVLVLKGDTTLPNFPNTGNTGSGNFYHFVDTSGDLQGLWAINPSVALDTAYQLGVHSGVVLVK